MHYGFIPAVTKKKNPNFDHIVAFKYSNNSFFSIKLPINFLRTD